MEQKDFLIREIEKLTQVIKKLLGILEDITSENFEIEFGKIDNELCDSFGFSLEELANLENTEFIRRIKDIDENNLELLSILISEITKKIESTTNNSNLNSRELAKKGIVLIDFIDNKSKTFSIDRMNLKKNFQQKL